MTEHALHPSVDSRWTTLRLRDLIRDLKRVCWLHAVSSLPADRTCPQESVTFVPPASRATLTRHHRHTCLARYGLMPLRRERTTLRARDGSDSLDAPASPALRFLASDPNNTGAAWSPLRPLASGSVPTHSEYEKPTLGGAEASPVGPTASAGTPRMLLSVGLFQPLPPPPPPASVLALPYLGLLLLSLRWLPAWWLLARRLLAR